MTSATFLDSITRTLAEICASGADDDFSCDPPRRFSALTCRLQLLFQHLSIFADLSSSLALIALSGIAGDLEASRAIISTYRRPSRILILINCDPLCASLRIRASSISSSLTLLDSSLSPFPDLQKKAANLSHDFMCLDLRLTDNEKWAYRILQNEAELWPNSKAVQSAIIMDIARGLVTDLCDRAKLSDHIRQFRSDISSGSSVAERKILMSLEKFFQSWSIEPFLGTTSPDTDFEENALIPPFKSFICPLTKEVMKDPVVLESSQNYDRSAILKWFDRCKEDGRVPTCPMTGQKQITLGLKRNIGLAGAIEEWVNRNIEVQIKVALQCLGKGELSSDEDVVKVLDSVYRIFSEHPESRYKVRKAGIADLVMQMMNKQSKVMGSHLRGKALMALHSMSKNEESKSSSSSKVLRSSSPSHSQRSISQQLVGDQQMQTSPQRTFGDSMERGPRSECAEGPLDIFRTVNSCLVKLKKPLHVVNKDMKKEVERAKNATALEHLRSGMVLLKNFIKDIDQVKILNIIRDLGIGPGGFYRPGYKDRAKLHLHMMCLGLDWDPDSKLYSDSRSFDGAVPPEIPCELRDLVNGAFDAAFNFLMQSAKSADEIPTMSPDICIVNFYSKYGKYGLHQDKDESPESLEKGLPVVSFSIGDSAEFLYSDERDVNKADKVILESGDVLIFGGKSRHIFHGVPSIIPDTAPQSLINQTNLRPGRLNLTFRQY